ncbi:Uncharacterized domain 1-containing protein [uncultured Gammaproteobacteria bacterium]
MTNTPAISIADLNALIREGVPMIGNLGVEILALAPGTIRLRLPCQDDFVRPGGTVTGPILFALADVALYGAVLGLIGRVELAVTTSMTINFLRRPPMRAVLAEARVLKLGKRLAYGEILLFSEGDDQPVAHVTGTYSIPPHALVDVPPPGSFQG